MFTWESVLYFCFLGFCLLLLSLAVVLWKVSIREFNQRLWSFSNLLISLNQKLWMTIGLGTFYLVLFLFFNLFVGLTLSKVRFSYILADGMACPQRYFAYGILFVAANAMLLQLVRLSVIRMYRHFKN